MPTYDISVIVATYHPDLKKLLTTISQTIKQKDIKCEVIISDDGSDVDWFNEIREYFKEKCFSDYRLIKNKDNVGTVKNIYNSVCEAKGKYVFCTSPGDYLHDEMTLCDFFNYSEKSNSSIVFGNAVYYSVDTENKPEIHSVTKPPFWPELFNSKSSFKKETAFFFGNYIVGATIFRERIAFKKQLETLMPYCKYVEDNTSVAYALLEKERIQYYDRSIVFYEYGVGISTSKDNKWAKILESEFCAFFEYLNRKYPNNKPIAAAYHHYKYEHGLKEKISRIVRYPTVCFVQFVNGFRKKVIAQNADAEKKIISEVINEKLYSSDV